ncbi:RNA-directed DNA polymerase, eukaryota [Tanacetum coccineum]
MTGYHKMFCLLIYFYLSLPNLTLPKRLLMELNNHLLSNRLEWKRGLNDIHLEGYSFTWAHPSAAKMSKLDRFLVTDGLLSSFPHILAVCLDRHLSDHRPILLWEIMSDFGATPFRLYHSWFSLPGFDLMVTNAWNSFNLEDSNGWSIEGDENSKFFHGVINKKRKNLSVEGVMIEGEWTAFLPNRQILDGPFIINEILSRCKYKNQQAMIFKVDFAKAYDSITWDYLDDVLKSFGFGVKWRSWIHGSLNSSKASILVNGSPTSEFQFHRGLKQGDPLAPFLFILIMESLHLSFTRAGIRSAIFKGIRINESLMISHLFYADDALFIGEWSNENLQGILYILNCFSLMSGMSINLKKSHILVVKASPDPIAF